MKKFLLAFILNEVYADAPVHCLRENIYGTWEFHVTKDISTVNLFEMKEVCTHSMPNKYQFISADH